MVCLAVLNLGGAGVGSVVSVKEVEIGPGRCTKATYNKRNGVVLLDGRVVVQISTRWTSMVGGNNNCCLLYTSPSPRDS